MRLRDLKRIGKPDDKCTRKDIVDKFLQHDTRMEARAATVQSAKTQTC